MTEPIPEPQLNPPSPSNAKRKAKSLKGHEITSVTIRAPPHAYAHLSLLSSSSQTSSTTKTALDALTVRTHLTSALRQFLGTHGTAIAVDILKIEDQDCWVRVPREDLSAFVAAVGGWVGHGSRDGEEEGGVGWRVVGKGNWLGKLSWGRGAEKIWND